MVGGGQKLTVVWPIDKDCGISYKDLFSDDMFHDIDIEVIEMLVKEYYNASESDGVRRNIQKKQYTKAIHAGVMIAMTKLQEGKISCLHLGKEYIDYEPPQKVGWSDGKYKKHIKNMWECVKEYNINERKKDIYIHAYCGIIEDEEACSVDYSHIKFKKYYWDRVHEILGEHDVHIGIHIRRTDHKAAIKESMTSAFTEKIEAILREKGDNVKFFLATDDKAEEKYLTELYGEYVTVQDKKEWGRSNSHGMKSGLIDCLCLTQCEYILGSYASVFSSFASKYGNKPLIICKSTEDI